jgi:SAM-dependent methyltransferase
MDSQARQACQTSYDAVADEYVQRIFDELQHKPLDRELLGRFADRVREIGPACDLGCGPGHVAQYLAERGVKVIGIDFSPAMIERARRLVSGAEFRQGDMLALNEPDEAFAGIAAFYSLIHVPRESLPLALVELRRVLKPGGLLLLAFHIGDETIHLDEWWGHQVNVDFHFFRPAALATHLRAAGFAIEEIIERDPYPDIEHQSRRGYIFARRPESKRSQWVSDGHI